MIQRVPLNARGQSHSAVFAPPILYDGRLRDRPRKKEPFGNRGGLAGAAVWNDRTDAPKEIGATSTDNISCDSNISSNSNSNNNNKAIRREDETTDSSSSLRPIFHPRLSDSRPSFWMNDGNDGCAAREMSPSLKRANPIRESDDESDVDNHYGYSSEDDDDHIIGLSHQGSTKRLLSQPCLGEEEEDLIRPQFGSSKRQRCSKTAFFLPESMWKLPLPGGAAAFDFSDDQEIMDTRTLFLSEHLGGARTGLDGRVLESSADNLTTIAENEERAPICRALDATSASHGRLILPSILPPPVTPPHPRSR